MDARKPQENDASLPFVALRLLAPPVRLMSAALWKVMKQRDVMQYGIVEEFVTSACETVPALLTLRHRCKLTLGFRARLILELCRKQPDPKVIGVHLKKIKVPATLSSSLTSAGERDVKYQITVKDFNALVKTLLTDPAERERYFKEVFPVNYGPTFDQELEKLLWEFLIRLDQLLPVPSLAQTALWLSEAPPVLQECARAATQPQLLEILLQHQTCLGHLDTAASLPPNMGDYILASLSLPPSGKELSNQPTGSEGTDQSTTSASFIKPVIGLISNDNVPFINSATKRLRNGKTTSTKDDENIPSESSENTKCTVIKEKQASVNEEGDSLVEKLRSNGKRKHVDESDSTSDEEEEILRKASTRKKRSSSSCKSIVRPTRSEPKRSEAVDGDQAVLKTCSTELGFKTLHLPDDRFLRSIFVSCLNRQPKVVVEKLSLTSLGASNASTAGKSLNMYLQNQRSISPAKNDKRKPTRTQPKTAVPDTDNKENTPTLPGSHTRFTSLRQKSNTESQDPPGESEDYVADSEDEATKNFKGRLFAKRYCKTKHGTYIPTLREYWKPYSWRRSLFGPGGKRR